jgi:tRNA(fMet)-specific endonuclease VapC
MALYMLDTNIASHIIKGDMPHVRERLTNIPLHEITVSAVTQAELLYGVAKRGHPHGLVTRVHGFLVRVTVLAWTHQVANVYGDLRAECEADGITLAPMDMMIAAHAKATSATLVTRDKVFSRIAHSLSLQDWTSSEK